MNAGRRISVVTSTRADYGLLYWLLRAIDDDPALELHLIVTGSHLSPEFGMTVKEIEADGFRIDRRIEILLASDSHTGVTKSMGLAMLSFGEALAEDRPDILVVLGDRYEIVLPALAAVVHGIPVAHIHGGETSQGAIDEYFRHAVTKLASIHFPATEVYRQRILQMGEAPAHTFNVGAPGLDHLYHTELLSRSALAGQLDLSLDPPTALVTYHPVTTDDAPAAQAQVESLLEALRAVDGLQAVFTKANADTTGRAINERLASFCRQSPERFRLFDNLGHQRYLSCLKHLSLMVGNSSSGLTEAPSFRLPVVNVGDRQKGRLQAQNVIQVDCSTTAITEGIRRALSDDFRRSLNDSTNPYDRFADGGASRRIMETLKTIPLGPEIRKKAFRDLPWEAPDDHAASD